MFGIREPSIWHEKYSKNQFSQKLKISGFQGPLFITILMTLGYIFMILEGLKMGLKSDVFPGLPWGMPDLATFLVHGNAVVFGLGTKTREAET